MAPYSSYRNNSQGLRSIANQLQPNIAFVVMIFGALIAFEIFNYSTTDHALNDLLGNLKFLGLRWSTVLAIAFCGIDFAGIARLFTPEQGMEEPKEVWYLFGAWLLAATMNAILTWWGVSMAVANHTVQSSAVIDPQTIMTVVPVFVAVMVWVIRILIIGTLSLAMDRLMHPGLEQRVPLQNAISVPAQQPQRPARVQSGAQPASIPGTLNAAIQPRPALSRASVAQQRHASARQAEPESEYEPAAPGRVAARPEPTYHSLSMASRPSPANRPSAADRAGENNGRERFRRP